MKTIQRIAGLCIVTSLAALLCATAQADGPPAAATKGCGPSITEGRSAADIAKITEETRKVAEAFSNTRSEKEFLAPNAIWWAAGVGYIDPEKFFTTKHGPDRGPPLSYKNTVHGITVEGDRAAIEMSHLVVWPDFTYDQHYHNLIVVRNGKICLLKMFTDTSMSKKLVPDLKGTPEIPK